MRPAAVREKMIQAGSDKCQVLEAPGVLEAQHKGCVARAGGQGENHGGKSPKEWSQTDDGPGSLGSTLDLPERGGEILKGFRWSGILKELLLPLLFEEKLKLIKKKATAVFRGAAVRAGTGGSTGSSHGGQWSDAVSVLEAEPLEV